MRQARNPRVFAFHPESYVKSARKLRNKMRAGERNSSVMTTEQSPVEQTPVESPPVAQSDKSTPRKPLRLWPGIIGGALVALGWFIVPMVIPAAALYAMLGGVAGVWRVRVLLVPERVV